MQGWQARGVLSTAPTPPTNSPARTALRAPGHVPSPHAAQRAFGPVSELARPEAGRKEESDLKSHSSFPLPPPIPAFPKSSRISANGNDARGRIHRSSRAPRAQRRVSPNRRTQ